MDIPSSPASFHSLEEFSTTEEEIPATSEGLMNDFFMRDKHKELVDDKKIDFHLKNALEYIFFDSEIAVAAYPGCLRFGIITIEHTLGIPQCGFTLKSMYEIPIYKIKAFVHELMNHFPFFYQKKNSQCREVVLLEIKENLHLVTQANINQQKKTCSFLKRSNEGIIHEIKFSNPEKLLAFAQSIFKIILSIASPSFLQQECVSIFLNKLSLKPAKACSKLFEHWLKREKKQVLWDGIAETLLHLNKTCPSPDLTRYQMNFFLNNIEIVHSMFLLYKISIV